MVAFPRPRTAKPDAPAKSGHVVVELTAKSTHAYLGLLALEVLISDLQEEFPWKAELGEAGRLILEIANNLDFRPPTPDP